MGKNKKLRAQRRLDRAQGIATAPKRTPPRLDSDRAAPSFLEIVRGTADGERRAALDILDEKGTTKSAITALTDNAHGFAALLMDVKERTEGPSHLACKPGCSWCCHDLPVSVGAVEVIRIADGLRARLSADELASLREHCVEAAAKRRALSREAWKTHREPCPLLVDDVCSVYADRPLSCRGWNSMNAEVCKRSVENADVSTMEDVDPVQRHLHSSIAVGLLAALASRGLDAEELELVAALAVALTTENVAERWLAGERLWASAAFGVAVPGAHANIVEGQRRSLAVLRG